VHRDVKPSNILVDASGRVVLLDFGLVADSDQAPGLDEPDVVGTAAYMAPEQALGKPVGPEADWYAVAFVWNAAQTQAVADQSSSLNLMCEWAWRVGIQPLLRHIGPRDAERPLHLVLVPTGPYGLIPWHAAFEGTGETRRYALQSVVFSYALSAERFCASARQKKRELQLTVFKSAAPTSLRSSKFRARIISQLLRSQTKIRFRSPAISRRTSPLSKLPTPVRRASSTSFTARSHLIAPLRAKSLGRKCRKLPRDVTVRPAPISRIRRITRFQPKSPQRCGERLRKMARGSRQPYFRSG